MNTKFVPTVLTRKKEFVLIFEFKVPSLEDEIQFLPKLRSAVKPVGDTVGLLPPDYSLDQSLFEKLVVDVAGLRASDRAMTKEEKIAFVNSQPYLRRQALAGLFTNFEAISMEVKDSEELVIDLITRKEEEIQGTYRLFNPETKETSVETASFTMTVPTEETRLEYFSHSYGEVNPKEKSWKQIEDFKFVNQLFDKLCIKKSLDLVPLYVKDQVLKELFERVHVKNA